MKVRRALCTAAAVLATWAASGMPLAAAELAKYGAVRDLLVAHTKVVELTGENGQRIAVCPEYQGRIMTSSTGNLEGRSLGWVNMAFIQKGQDDPHFNNFGGEDRLWLAPEGGPFSLWFAPGAKQTLDRWVTPPALNDGAFQIVSAQDEPYYRMSRRMKLENAAHAQFDLEVSREIHLQKLHHFGKLFGPDAQTAATSLHMVGFQSINTVINRGAAMTHDRGLISIWSLGQFPSGPRTYIILPYRGGGDSSLGPIVNGEYFGRVPGERLRVSAEAIWFLGDGKHRENRRAAATGPFDRRLDRHGERSADLGSLLDAGGPDEVCLYEQQLGSAAGTLPGRRLQQLQRRSARAREGGHGRLLRARVAFAGRAIADW